MLNFQAVRDGLMPFDDLVAGLASGDLRPEGFRPEGLRALTHEMVDTMLALITGCVDADVVFQPTDPGANDPWAATPGEVAMPWTLGHVIVHCTASAEEAAALAAEMARGVELHGRSRYEVPWRQITTIDGCRQRLEESRRMRLASLDMWPAAPHLDNASDTWPGGPRVNAIGRFVLGLSHDDSHLGQIQDIVSQARAARQLAT